MSTTIATPAAASTSTKFAAAIERRRATLGITREELAERAEISINELNVKLDVDPGTIDTDDLAYFAEALELPDLYALVELARPTACPAWCTDCQLADSDYPTGPRVHSHLACQLAGAAIWISADESCSGRPHIWVRDEGGCDEFTSSEALAFADALRRAGEQLRKIEQTLA